MISDDNGETEREITTPILAVSFTDHMIQVSVWKNYNDASIVYLYGTEVKDYLSVDKPQLGVMALQGVKEVYTHVQAANAATSSQMAALNGTCAALQAANAATSSQMASIQEENTQLKSQVASQASLLAGLQASQESLLAWARAQGYSS
jgi:hypothetical protein